MMREVLTRRLSRALRGGSRQRQNNLARPDTYRRRPRSITAVAVEVLDELGINDLRVAAIAKGMTETQGVNVFTYREDAVYVAASRSSFVFCAAAPG